MMMNKPHIIEEELLEEQKRAIEEINFPNQFRRLQDEWAENVAEKFEEEAEKKNIAKKDKFSPGVMKKLREYRTL